MVNKKRLISKKAIEQYFGKSYEQGREEARKEIRKELDKILERLRGYGCGYHKQLEKQILNLKKKFKEVKNDNDV